MAEKKIGDMVVRVEKMRALQSQRFLIRIGKLLGPAADSLAQVIARTGEVSQIAEELRREDLSETRRKVLEEQRKALSVRSDAQAIQMFGEILTYLDPEDANQFLVDLCAMASVQEGAGGHFMPVRDETMFDHYFGDSLMTAWSVALYVLEVNYRSFFDVANRSGVVQRAMNRSSETTKSAA
jgi:hypothetical protein